MDLLYLVINQKERLYGGNLKKFENKRSSLSFTVLREKRWCMALTMLKLS